MDWKLVFTNLHRTLRYTIKIRFPKFIFIIRILIFFC